MKPDNEKYDRGLIAIYDDYMVKGNAFIDKVSLSIISSDSFMWHAAQAQETVDDIIYRMMKDD